MLLIATSDKGGTGRSVTGSNVVYRRALQGGDVCYVDFDFGSPTAGAIFGISALSRGTTTGSGTHSYLQGRSHAEEFWDVWQHSDRTSLRQRPPGTGRLVLVPGDAGGGEFSFDDDTVERCIDLFLRLHGEFEVVLVDLSAGRSYAADIVIAATSNPEMRGVTSRWLVFHRWTRQHVVAAHGLVYGERGLLDIGETYGQDREQFIQKIRFVRTALVDPNAPDLAGLRPPQLAWLREANRDLQRLAAELAVGRAAMLGAVPLDPVLQWREQLITDSDVWARHVANQATIEAFESIAKSMINEQAWEQLWNAVQTEFQESSADLKAESVPLSHVSVELGHLYLEDLAGGQAAMRETFAAVAPWVAAVQAPGAIGCSKQPVRVSTCFLIDDYFSRFSSPAEVIPMVMSAAGSEGLRIDYIARESACAGTRDDGPAHIVFGRLVSEPVPGTTGGRPPLTKTGWLTNGRRSPDTSRGEAMAKRSPWQPPQESARRRHSIFVDIELWDERDGHRTWSCPMLAAVWQLIRLGLLRDQGRPLLVPRDWAGELPDSWDEMPPITRLNRDAAAFTAYTTLSALSPRFLPVELAVRTILSQFAGEAPVLAEAQARAARDGMKLPVELVDRIRYVFAAPGETDPA